MAFEQWPESGENRLSPSFGNNSEDHFKAFLLTKHEVRFTHSIYKCEPIDMKKPGGETLSEEVGL